MSHGDVAAGHFQVLHVQWGRVGFKLMVFFRKYLKNFSTGYTVLVRIRCESAHFKDIVNRVTLTINCSIHRDKGTDSPQNVILLLFLS